MIVNDELREITGNSRSHFNIQPGIYLEVVRKSQRFQRPQVLGRDSNHVHPEI
jgi:hypothetical protein